MKPFLKWAGSKRQLLPELRKRVPEKFGRYFEPFVGSGALFFDLAPKRALLSDSNVRLISTYEELQIDMAELRMHLREMASEYNGKSAKDQEAIYRATRSIYNDHMVFTPSSVLQAARFIFLNKTGFNGLYRVAQKTGHFNVPWGKRTHYEVDGEVLKDCAVALQGVELRATDFEDAVAGAQKGDFVYFDPPYVPASATANFTAYSKEPFGPAEQERLRNVALRLKQRGVHVLLSNSDTPLVHELYCTGSHTFDVRRVEARRSINSKGGARGKVGEVLIT